MIRFEAVWAAKMATGGSVEPSSISKDVIRASYLEQGKLAQAHAWIGLGDVAHVPPERMSGLEAACFEISRNGVTLPFGVRGSTDDGRQVVRSAVFANNWRALADQSALSVSADIPDTETETGFLHAVIVFKFDPEPARVPLMSAIEIMAADPAQPLPSRGADFQGSRLLSTNHRWHTLVEDPNRAPEPFKELLGDRFKMEFGHGSVNSYEEFCDWVHGSASSVNASRHDLESFTWAPLQGDDCRAVFVLDWLGLNREDKVMTAKTKHTWIMTDDGSGSYPKIQHMNVEFLQAFAVID